jgi:4-amino-4-deoxy-L-arabinose transferase-like glycosyltransferase
MTALVTHVCRRWVLIGLTVVTFFFFLGGRSLNEPDEGRYAEIAREMIERGDWLIPHLWHAPHLDKPPFTYWAVAASMSLFGQNEWAVRLPLALAGISGVLATCLLARNMGGGRAGFWAAVILQSSALYFVMARMLTTDIFLTQFVTWAAYYLWRSWRALDGGPPESLAAGSARTGAFWIHTMAAWAAMALGFLTKGPLALLLPLAALSGLVLYRRRERRRQRRLVVGALAGLVLFALIAAPWYVALWNRVPGAYDYMVFGQAVGHALGTAIKNRQGNPLYFVAILAVGFIPWTLMLGWLWRRRWWASLPPASKEAWLFLSVWAWFTIVFFSLSRAKLPAYILPMFPPLAVMAGWRWAEADSACGMAPRPAWLWRGCLLAPAVAALALPLAVYFVFKPPETAWLTGQGMAGVVSLGLLWWRWRDLTPVRCIRLSAVLALLNLYWFALAVPSVETSLRHNQTLKPLGQRLQAEYRPGDVIVCWGRFPQGLPFYAAPIINATNRPYLGALALDQVPFESAGNRARFEPWLVPDEAALVRLLEQENRVWLVASLDWVELLRRRHPQLQARLLLQCGLWDLFTNR